MMNRLKELYLKHKDLLFGIFVSTVFGIASILQDNKTSIFILLLIIIGLFILIIFLFGKYKFEKKKREKKKNYHKRFEKIINQRIPKNKDEKKRLRPLKYLSIEYEPFYYETKTPGGLKKIPSGIGWDVMNKIFEPFDVDIIKYGSEKENNEKTYNWETIFEEFSDRKKDIDFIITPMYETRSRLYKYDVIYTIPLFYSDIGIYVRKDDVDEKYINGVSYEAAKKLLNEKHNLKSNKKWEPLFLVGEISEILGKKLMTKEKLEINKKVNNYEHQDFVKLLINVSDKNTNGDVVFMEVFKAISIIKENKLEGKVINILKKNQLLYPVSFAIRKEETVLRNFLNLRIAELKMNGTLNRIIRKNAFEFKIPEKKINERFLQLYDYKLIKDDYKEKPILFSDRMKKEYDLLQDVYKNYVEFQESIKEKISKFRSGDKLNILEIGFGTGITSKIILETKKKNEIKSLILLDSDDEMKTYAYEYLSNHIPGNTFENSFVIDDINSFLENYKGEKFDLVVSGYTIHNFNADYRERMFTLLKNKMSDNSMLVNADKYSYDDTQDRIRALNYRINKFIKHLLEKEKELEKKYENNPLKKEKEIETLYSVVEEWVTHYIEDQSPDKVMKISEAKEQLVEIGFENIETFMPNLEGESVEKLKEDDMMHILIARINKKITSS